MKAKKPRKEAVDAIPIESNIPIPNPRVKYPFDGMEIGDSFIIPEGINPAGVIGNANRWGKLRNGRRFCIRKIKGAKGKRLPIHRLWRIE